MPTRSWEELLYGVLDGIGGGGPPEPLAQGLAWEPRLGAHDMHVNALLAKLTCGLGLSGLLAEVVVEAPQRVTWTMVLLTAIPAISLAIRATYSYGMRRLESRERLALIAKGITPPPLPNSGVSPPP
jgi:hypothetical protein